MEWGRLGNRLNNYTVDNKAFFSVPVFRNADGLKVDGNEK